jgi:hypothetical protein
MKVALNSDARLVKLKAIRSSNYRSILNTCQQPAGIGLIWGDLPGKKLSWQGLQNICKLLVFAKLLVEQPAKDFKERETRYMTTDAGLRLLKKWRSRRSNSQFITGFDIPKG